MATAALGQSVDLCRLTGTDGFLYDQAVYHCAYLEDEKTRAKISVFATGKMISVGAKSYEAAKRDLNYAARRLADLGLISPTRIRVELQNIVATADLGCPIDIERLARQLPNVIYEPEQFPAAIYHAKELEGASILVFASGRVVFAGLRRREMLEVGKRVLADLSLMVDGRVEPGQPARSPRTSSFLACGRSGLTLFRLRTDL